MRTPRVIFQVLVGLVCLGLAGFFAYSLATGGPVGDSPRAQGALTFRVVGLSLCLLLAVIFIWRAARSKGAGEQ